MTTDYPRPYADFMEEYRDVWEAYDRLGAVIHQQGVLDDRSRALVKLAIAVGARSEGAVHAHARKALEAGASADEIRHTVLLALTTVGFPNMMAAMTWVNDVL